jgi:GNAT superfamily N-acetyltransferase
VSVTVRRASPADFAWVIDLIDRNRAEAIPAEERGTRGFVQGQWDADVLERLSSGPGIFIADVDGSSAGFAVTSAAGAIPSGPAGRTNELAEAAFPEGSFFLYGPVVVDDAFRRRGLLQSLVSHLRQARGDRYAAAIAFVKESNQASMAAHARVGFEPFASFENEGRRFGALALTLDKRLT